MKSKSLSQTTSCGHCSNVAPMESIGHVFIDTTEESSKDPYPEPDAGYYYDILICPACKRENIVKYFWHEFMESEEDLKYDILYPQRKNIPLGLPENIKSTFKAAEMVVNIDVNAYAMLMRRLLELVCIDREAKGSGLAIMLGDLAKKSEIPSKLVDVAKGLKDFGNIGAHSYCGSLSEGEVPIVSALTKSILEYLYTAPYLASLAEERLKELRSK